MSAKQFVSVAFAFVSIAVNAAARLEQPELFAPNIVSTPDDEFGIAFEPDGKTAYFTKRSPTTNTPPVSVICVTHRVNGRWTEPEVAAFSGRFNDFGIAVAPDGRHIVFSSDRPTGGASKTDPPNVDLWIVEKDGDRWSEPRNLGAPINSPATDAYPSIAADGTLYFASSRPGGSGAMDIYRSDFVDGHYTEPTNLTAINSPGQETQPAISPDGAILVFTSTNRSDTMTEAGAPYPRSDLYASFKSGNAWSAPIHLDAPINSPASDGNASFSPDGKSFYFSSDRGFVTLPMSQRLNARDYENGVHGILNGWNNIYRISASAILKMREPANATGDRAP